MATTLHDLLLTCKIDLEGLPVIISSTRKFQLLARHPALDFVNTLDWRFRESGPEELLETYTDLVQFAVQSTLVSSAQANWLLRLRDARVNQRTLTASKVLRETCATLFYGKVDQKPPADKSIHRIHEFLSKARECQRLVWTEGKIGWTWGTTRDPELPLHAIALSVFQLLSSDKLAKSRACLNPECRWLFLDTSKNQSRRWCDMKLCGNRMKARRYKARNSG